MSIGFWQYCKANLTGQPGSFFGNKTFGESLMAMQKLDPSFTIARWHEKQLGYPPFTFHAGTGAHDYLHDLKAIRSAIRVCGDKNEFLVQLSLVCNKRRINVNEYPGVTLKYILNCVLATPEQLCEALIRTEKLNELELPQ